MKKKIAGIADKNDNEELDLPLVYVEWEDAKSLIASWKTLEESIEWGKKIIVNRQAGFLIEDTPDHILLAGLYIGTTRKLGTIFKIPTTWIRFRKNIKIK